MKKLIRGCAVVILLVATLIVGLGIYGFLKVKKAGADISRTRTEMQALNVTYPFATPVTPAMEPVRLNDFFAVRTSLMKLLEQDPVIAKMQGSKQEKLTLSDAAHLAIALPKKIATEFQLQLTAKQMSPDEYTWFVKNVYTTIYEGKMKDDREMTAIYDVLDENLNQFNLQLQQMKNGAAGVGWKTVVNAENNASDEAKATNRELVLDHKDDILNYPQLAFLELMFSRSLESAKSASTSPAPLPTPTPTP